MIARGFVKPVACMAVGAVLNGCASALLLGSTCNAPPPRADWEPTAAEGRVEGQVRELKGGDPIGNVEVVLDSGTARQRTDGQGNFSFDGVHEGRHILTTNGTVYLALHDTLSVLPRGGLKGTVHLTLPRDVLTRCGIYKP
ncbi:MAG: hypothetical protein ACJ8AD_11665 [Gemmatimonadaceae bacterium]